jgi:catechol 2,3-dioxygenase
MTDESYSIPPQTRIGHVHLKVSDLQRSLEFYSGLLGFELTQSYGHQVAFLSAGGYHHQIALNTWFSKGSEPAPRKLPGLFHTAIVYPSRRDLARILKRTQEANYPLTGSADHGVSEALYLDDPDGNGVELYWDKPREEWPFNEDGRLEMYTRMLNLKALLSELEADNLLFGHSRISADSIFQEQSTRLVTKFCCIHRDTYAK